MINIKKTIQYYGEFLYPVKLYLDDLKKIEAMLNEVSKDIKIESEGYEFSNIDELIQLQKESIETLCMKIYNPYLSIEFKKNEVWLYIADDTALSRGIYEKIKDYLYKHKRNLSWVRKNSLYTSIILIGYSIISGFFIKYMGITFAKINLAFMIGMFLLVIYFSRAQFSLIYLVRRVEKPSFVERNKDRIILSIISAVFGGLVTWILRNY